MKLSNIEKDKSLFTDLLSDRLLFSRESLIEIQDTIELAHVRYSQENIDNVEFLSIIADRWPEAYDTEEYPGVYQFTLNHAGKDYIKLTLDIYLHNDTLYIDGITVEQYQ